MNLMDFIELLLNRELKIRDMFIYVYLRTYKSIYKQ